MAREEKKKKRREDWKNEPEFESHNFFFSFPDQQLMETPCAAGSNDEWYAPNL